jgi:hypothetical protein
MPKTILIEARTRPTPEHPTGQRGFVEKEYPLNLQEAVEMWGEKDTFKYAVQTKVIMDQREARPVSDNGDSTEQKPKKRLSVFDRLSD